MTVKALQSDFAILDVKHGRIGLGKHLDANQGHVPVVITGWITRVRGNDDGVSQEFTVEVDKVEITSE